MSDFSSTLAEHSFPSPASLSNADTLSDISNSLARASSTSPFLDYVNRLPMPEHDLVPHSMPANPIRYIMSKPDTLHLLFGKMVGAGLLWTVGELLAQAIERHRLKRAVAEGDLPQSALGQWKFDFARTCRIIVWATYVFAPTVTFWYGFLGLLFPTQSVSHTIYRVAVDQLFWAPLFLAIFFMLMTLFANGTMEMVSRKVHSRWWPTLKINWVVWPVVQFLNFMFVPPQQQVLFVNLVNVPWTAFLAMQANPEAGADDEDDAEASLTAKGAGSDDENERSPLLG